MNLLFTGASGFLGRNVCPLLNKKYVVKTVGLTLDDDYRVNLATEIPQFTEQYDIIVHAAGKAHSTPTLEKEKKVFFDVNLEGTKNLCTALESSGIPKAFIFISTVAVYGCDFGEDITEEYPLNGNTPYALSKIKAERYLENWCAVHHVRLGIIRPSLLAGPNPPGNLGAMIAGISKNKYFSIAGGKARKSVLMVQDIAQLIPLLVEKGGIYNVCDDEHPTFRELEKVISRQLHKPLPRNIPYWVAKILSVIGDCLGAKAPINSSKLGKITKSLTFSNKKIKRDLNWQPLSVISNFKI